MSQALAEAFGHRSYVLLVLGFFTCGFQIFFVTVHLPAYLVDRGLSAEVGGWTLGDDRPVQYHRRDRRGLAGGYPAQALHPVVHLFRPRGGDPDLHHAAADAVTTLIFGAVLGLLWLSTVPPTSGLVALMFGTRWLTMLFGFAFFSHQVGGFLGVWLGGCLFERTGSYDVVWWLSILLRRVVGRDQPADRRKAGAAARRRPALNGRPTCMGIPRSPPPTGLKPDWRTPAVIVVCGCLIAIISYGPALGVRLLPDADVEGERLGPRRLRALGRGADADLRRGPAVLGRARRSLRHDPRDHRRRAALCGRRDT